MGYRLQKITKNDKESIEYKFDGLVDCEELYAICKLKGNEDE